MIKYKKRDDLLKNRIVWYIEIENNFTKNTLLISKLSQALSPNEKDNHIGEGGTFDDFLQKQNINGGLIITKKIFMIGNIRIFQ